MKTESDDDGQYGKMNDEVPTPNRIFYPENDNSQIPSKIMEELEKQAEKLAKLDNKISTLENKMHKDYNNLRRKIEKC